VGHSASSGENGLRNRYTETDWKKIAGFRDVLTHGYFGIKTTILWDNAVNRLPAKKKEIRRILRDEETRS
jgi:uncharacterized protein with HEPN domain